jgi:putative salt-induced outer membrane protein YdiY
MPHFTRIPAAFTAAAFVLIAAAAARADQVKLKNGDVLTGTITAIDGGKLVLKTVAAGDVTIDLAQVDSFATDNPAKVEVKKGPEETEVVEGKVDMASGGNVSIAAAGGARTVPLADLASINKPPFKAEWKGSLVGAATITRGNTVTDSTAIEFDAVRRGLVDRITFDAWYRSARSRDPSTFVTSTTQRQMGEFGKYDYFLSKKLYAYAMERAEKDAIADVDLRFTAGVGLGWQVIESADTNFNTEGGLGWFQEEHSAPTPTDEGLSARVAYHFDHILFKKYETAFFNDASAYKVFGDPDDYLVHFKAGLREKLTDSFFAQQWVDWTWDSTPAPGKKRDDVVYYIGIGWTF